jgi:hypothetical protein
MIHDEHNDSADDRYKHAVQIEAGYSDMAAQLEQPTANKRPDHSKDSVEEDTRPLAIYDLAGDKAGNQSENNPANDRHLCTSVSQSASASLAKH